MRSAPRGVASRRFRGGQPVEAGFLRSQADALLACDLFETVTLSGARM